MLTVHLRVNDSATGRPTPVRLRLSGPDGARYAPLGRVADFARGRNEDVGGHLLLGGERWYYIDGACEVRLPDGVPLRVQAAKGPEYWPLDRTATLGPGQMALRFAVERGSDPAAEGWVAGDGRCHCLSPHAALLEAGAEGLVVVELLARVEAVPSPDGTVYDAVANLLAFSGQAPALESDGRLVAVNTLNSHPVLGRVALLHAHRPIYPLTFGGDGDTDDWSICDWCDQCHRKGGLAVWIDAFRPERGLVGGEALAAAVLGKIDALEIDARPRSHPLLPWVYRLWSAGLQLPLVGGSGKDSNRVPLGAMRTYARVLDRERPPYAGWIEAVRAGRTYATDGPLLALTVAGQGPGATVDGPADGGPLPVAASARSLRPFDALELVADGVSIARATPACGPDGAFVAALRVGHVPRGRGWLAARCRAAPSPDRMAPAVAHTSPVFLRPAGRPCPRPRSSLDPLRAALARSREWVEAHGRFADERRKRQLIAHHVQALARLDDAGAGP